MLVLFTLGIKIVVSFECEKSKQSVVGIKFVSMMLTTSLVSSEMVSVISSSYLFCITRCLETMSLRSDFSF